MSDQQQSIWARLKQHHIYRVAVGYGTAIAVLIQVVARAFPYFGWSAAVPAVIIILIAGFPVALMLAWLLVKPADPAVQSIWQRRHWKLGAVVIPVVIAAVVVSSLYAWHFSERYAERLATEQAAVNVSPATATPAAATVIPAKSIAVLPFENLSIDKANAYFADGMQDLILTKLAEISDLKVIARTSTAKYASQPDDLRTIGEQLGVATILEGSVQKAGNQVLINVQLVDARTDAHIWAASYQRTLDNIFGVEGEVAQSVADALKAKLTSTEEQNLAVVPTQNPAAYQAYLKALELEKSSNNSLASFEPVIDDLQTAVELDPNFTLAWAELANQQLQIYWYGLDPTQMRLDAAKAALERAEAQNPGLPQVRLARAFYLYHAQLDFHGALAVIREVLPDAPNDAQAWYYAALLERRLGQWDASMKDLKHAQVLDPLNNQIDADLLISLAAEHHFKELLSLTDGILSAHPDVIGARELQLFAIWNLDDLDGADRVLASMHSQAGAPIALRAQQALYRRNFRAASDLFAHAVASGDEFHSEFFVGSYVPARIGWQLRQALSEQRTGSEATATGFYRQVQTQARAALVAKPVSTYVAAAWHAVLGLASAGVGQRQEAVTEGRRAVALIPESKDAFEGPLWMDYLAQIYAFNGDAAHAVPLIKHLLQTNGSQITPVQLRLDPVWDPIRHDPRFQALLQQYAKYKPAVTYNTSPAATPSASASTH